MIAQRCRQLRQHAGAIGNGQAQIIAAPAAGDVGRRQGGKRRHRHAKGVSDAAARDVDDIGDHSAGRGAFAGAASLKQQAPDEITFRDHGVQRPAGRRQRVIERHQRRMHALKQLPLAGFGQADKLDAKAQSRRLVDIGEFHGADALGGDGRKIDAGAKGQGGQDRQFMGGIDAIDIKTGVGLGIAGGLGFGEDMAEIQPFIFHPRQDIIAGAVEQAINPGDAVGGHALRQALDDGDATGDRGFIFEREALGFGGSGKVKAMVRQHRLVGGDQRLAGRQRAPCQGQRRAIGTADQFDNDIDIIATGKFGRVINPDEARQIKPAFALAIPRADGGNADRPPGAAGDEVGIGIEHPDNAGADIAQSGQTDTQGVGHRLAPKGQAAFLAEAAAKRKGRHCVGLVFRGNPRQIRIMRALVCHHLAEDRSGLRLEANWPEPSAPGPGEVTVAIDAAALNFPDLLMLAGGYQFKPELPFIPGTEACGRVIATGPGAEALHGQRVIIGGRGGCFAQRLTLPMAGVRPVPMGLDDAEAAAFTVGALTAWVGLMRRGRLQAGERVLVTGAGGGMGLAAVALAALEGAEVVAAASSEAGLALACGAGAHDAVLIDRAAPALALRDIDVVFDPVGGALALPALRTLRRGGRYLIIGFTGGRPAPLPLNRLLLKEVEVLGVRAGEYGRQDPAAGISNIAAIDARAGALRPQIGLRLPLDEGAQAFAMMAAGTLRGKAVLLP